MNINLIRLGFHSVPKITAFPIVPPICERYPKASADIHELTYSEIRHWYKKLKLNI